MTPAFRSDPKGDMRHRRNMAMSALVSSALVVPAASAAGCVPSLHGEAVRTVRSGIHVVAWRPEPARIPVGAHFTLELAVCSADGNGVEAVAVDADMPAHRHGMNYRPSLAALGGGRFRAEGLLFHMPGYWRLTIELQADRAVVRLADEFMVE